MARERSWQDAYRRFPAVQIVLLVGVLVVYILTLSPGVLGGDVGELQFVPYILGMAHPTGTPLYCLLGKLWTMLPFGPTVAWRMNLLSALSAGLAIVVVYYLARWCTERSVPALIAALSLAFGITFWEQATMADKYAFNALMVALILYLVLRWGATSSPTVLSLLAFTYGLSLTHHRTMVLFAPMLVGYVWWHERSALWRDWRRLLRLAALFLAPLFVYLYLPWAESRNLPPGTWHPRTLGDWYHYVADTGQIGFLYIDPADLGERLWFYARTLQYDFTWVGVMLGIGGMLWQFRRRPPDAIFLLANFVLQAFLAANHHLPRQWTFFIPSFIIFAVWLGEGVGVVWRGFERLCDGRRREKIAVFVALTLLGLALPLASFRGRYSSFRDIHHGVGVLDVWRQALKQGHMGDRLGKAIVHVDQNAVIVSDWEQATTLWYFQQVEGLRPDVQIVYPIERLQEAAASGRPLYIARNYPGLADRWHPSSDGPLIALEPEPLFDLPPNITPVATQLGDSFELAGFAYGEAEFLPATVVPLTLFWRVLEAPAHDYSVSLRLFDEGGQEIFKVDSQHPVLGTYPTSQWNAEEVVGDYYEIQLPGDLPSGMYHWGVILYRALPEGGWENLKVAGTNLDVLMGGVFKVRRRP